MMAEIVKHSDQEESLKTHGQRRINILWETTQAIIAVAVTLSTLIVCAFLIISSGGEAATGAFLILSNVFFLVVGTYFQRTNHTRVGGIGGTQAGER